MLVCTRCGKTEAQRNLEPPMFTGINHPVYYQTKSFYSHGRTEGKTYIQDVPYCPECHKEIELEGLMRTMDAYAKKHGEKALAAKCGLK